MEDGSKKKKAVSQKGHKEKEEKGWGRRRKRDRKDKSGKELMTQSIDDTQSELSVNNPDTDMSQVRGRTQISKGLFYNLTIPNMSTVYSKHELCRFNDSPQLIRKVVRNQSY